MQNTPSQVHFALLALLPAPSLADAALPCGIARRLRNMSCRELMLLARSGQPSVQVHFDTRAMQHALRAIRQRIDHEDRVDFFIEHGATTAMLRRLFRLPVADIKARRAQLLGPHRYRRPWLPTPAQRDAVHRAWWEIRDGRRRQAPTADEWLRLHKAFPAYTFATLEAIVNEFED